MKKSAYLLVLLLILSVVLVSLPPIGVVEAEPKTIVVPDNYATIQEAIDNASEGDTVYVESGVYIENLVINKFISLIGKDKDTTIIYCNDNNHPTVLVSRNGVNITGFTIQNNIRSPSNTRGGLAAVHLLQVSYCNIYENIMIYSGYGVWLYGSHYNNIFDNTIKNTNYGIFVESSLDNTIIRNTASNGWNGIWLQSASGNILRNNNMTDNSCDFGVSGTELAHYYNDIDTSNLVNGKKVYYLTNQENKEISSSFFPDLGFLALINCRDITVKNLNIINNFFGLLLFNTSNSTITHNYIGNNMKGIWLQYSYDITIYDNNIDSNSDDGIRLENSKRILIEGNTIQNTGRNGIYLGGGSDNNYIIENMMTENGNYAINIEASSNNTIINNEVTGSYFALRLYSSTKNKIESNRINSPKSESAKLTHCYQGIVIDHDSDNNVIVRNIISNNFEYGIKIQSSSYIFVSENDISNNKIGLQIGSSSSNTITANNISDSSEFAIRFLNSNNTVFQNNNLINNVKQIYSYGARGPSVNIWDNRTIGNFWSDYDGQDTNNDGKGDSPYIIDEYNQDNYPLITEFIIPEFPSWIILPLFLVTSLIIVLAKKKIGG